MPSFPLGCLWIPRRRTPTPAAPRRRRRPHGSGGFARRTRRAGQLAGLLPRLAGFAALLVVAPAAGQAGPPAEALGHLDWRHVGPVGNRVSAVHGVPGDPNVFYVGAASGGVWKSEDAGHAWRPVFDGQPVQSVGALAVAPSDPRVVWVGTGEAHIRSNVSHGRGVWRSTDGGESWRAMGLEETGRISRIVVHPDDPDVVYVAALGHLYGPQEERGVYRTTDGGTTWERVLWVDPDTGASDVVMMPGRPDVLLAGMWTMLVRTWGRWSGGPNDGIYMSRDGGDTWERLEGSGLPGGTTGKVALAVTPADPERIYALIETNANRAFRPEEEPLDQHEGVLWRSDDGGASWAMVNADHTLVQRPHYYTRVVAAPDDPDEVHFLATLHTVSYDGGETFEVVGGGDNHDMWIDPVEPARRLVGNDQGVKISSNDGRDWHRPLLPIAQMYHVTVDTEVPYNLYGNRQDGPSTRGPSRTLYGGGIPLGEWRSVGGCESGWAVPDTVSNDVVWSGCYEGILDRHRISTGHSRTVSVWPDNPEGWEAAPLRYRFQWTFPIHLSPHDPETVYVGSQHVHRTRNGGQSWEVISPDLTTDDESRQRRSGGLTPDDVSPTYYAVLFAIAESPLEPGVIWAGSNDGLVHLTRDGGETWTDVGSNIPGLPPSGTVSNIEPSRHAPGTAYLTVDRHQLGDFDPYVYRTRDHGATWSRIDAGLPRHSHAFTHVVREDPHRPGLLYVGTHNGVWASWDDGGSWTSLQGDLPAAPVHWLTVQPHFNDLVAGTYGRGFWILDDVTPLQRWDGPPSADPALLPPRAAYRFLPVESPNDQPAAPATGENPPDGASLTLWAGDDAPGPVTLEVLDEAGEVVRELRVDDPRPGLNRVWWDLRFTPSTQPVLRMPPVEHAHAWPEDWLETDATRGPPEGGRVRILAPPGRYAVRVAGDASSAVELDVRMDPASEGGTTGISAQTAMLKDLRAQVDRVAELITRMEWARREVERVRREARRQGHEDVVVVAEEAAAELEELESTLFDLRLTGGTAGQDALRWPRRLYAKLISLAGYVGGTDFPPTDQAREVHALYTERLQAREGRWAALRDGALASLDERVRAAGIEGISDTPPELR